MNAANDAGLKVELVDRDIQTTLKRAWKNMRLKEKFGLLWALMSDEEPDEEPMPETDDEPVVESPGILGDLLDED